MKAIYLAMVWVLTSTGALAEDWLTTDGKSYTNVKVIRVEDDAVTIIYSDGGALIPLAKLSSTLQKKFNYDPVKAKAAADARAKTDAENKKKLDAEKQQASKQKQDQQALDSKAAASTNAP